jgi:prepilin-type processing-associated H-X9-DG protein
VETLTMRRIRPRPATAFTLLELIVVVSIIVIITAVAIPIWQRAQGRGRAAACTSNLRQIGAALTRYCTEHDGAYPPLKMARLAKADEGPVLDTLLLPYVQDPRVFACPEDPKKLAELSGTSYLWNDKLNGQKVGSASVTFIKRDAIEEMTSIMVIGDKEGWHKDLKNGCNVLYADGHTSQELVFVTEEEAPK